MSEDPILLVELNRNQSADLSVNIDELNKVDNIVNKMHQQGMNSNFNGAQTSLSNNGHLSVNDPNTNCNMEENGIESVSIQPKITLDSSNKEMIRLIGQHLKTIGLEQSALALMKESGCSLEHPAAIKFRQHVLSGEWTKADQDLHEIKSIIDDSNTNIVEMKFLLLEQKYLEFLEEGECKFFIICLRFT